MAASDASGGYTERAGSGLNAKQLRGLLRPFGVRSRNLRLDPRRVAKGYFLDDLAGAFSRYSRYRLYTVTLPALATDRTRYKKLRVAGAELTQLAKPVGGSACSGTVRSGGGLCE